MKHADFEIVRVEEDRVFIVDCDLGSKSVTNDAEWVYKVVSKHFPGKRLIYRDSMGSWSEIAEKTSQSCDSWKKFTGKLYKEVIFIPYNQHLPNDDEITGCPSTAFFSEPDPKIKMNKIPPYWNAYKNYKGKWGKNYGK
jgi:hypothetical protein